MANKRRVQFDAREKGPAKPAAKKPAGPSWSRRHRRELAPAYAAVALLFGGWVSTDVDDAVQWIVVGAVVLAAAAGLLTRSWVDRKRERVVVVALVLATGGWLLAAHSVGITRPVFYAWAALALIGSVLWWTDWFQTAKTRKPRDAKPEGPKVKARGRSGAWHTNSGLAAAFEDAGLTRPGKDGEPAPEPTIMGRPDTDDYGTTVRVKLPRGVGYSKLSASREQLAAALDQPKHLVTVSQLRDDPAGVARIRVSLPYERTIRTHAIPDEGHSWRDPVVVGRDRRGRDVTFQTWNTGQVLVGGRTGSGKTHFLRLLASHYALDPEAELYIVDGKGSTDDWGPIRPRCTRLLFIHDDNPAERFTQLLEHVQGLVTDRNRRGGRDWPGALVILEEFSSLLASLDANEKKDTERAVTRLVQTCRSANVMVVIAAQRPSASTMDTNTRAQAAVSVALAMKSPTDITMVLGHTPTMELPDEPGEAILVVPGREDVFVDLDTIPDGDWDDLCSQWAPSLPAPALAGVPASTQPSLLDEDDDEPEPDVDHAQPITITSTVLDDEPEPLEHLTDDAELYADAVELVTTTQYASQWMLGRKLRIGWEHAGRLLAELEAREVVGPDDGEGKHPVLAASAPVSGDEPATDDREDPEPENAAETPEPVNPSNATEAVWQFALSQRGEFASSSVQIALEHYSRSSIKVALRTLVADGRLTKPRHGFYAVGDAR